MSLWKHFVSWLDWHGRISVLIMLIVSLGGAAVVNRIAAIWGPVHGIYLWIVSALVFALFFASFEWVARKKRPAPLLPIASERLPAMIEKDNRLAANQLVEVGPDVFLEWDLPDEGKKFSGLGMEKQIIAVNRSSSSYAYNVSISPIKLAEVLGFSAVDEIAPGQRIPITPHLDRADYKPLENFFAHEGNEQAARKLGLIKSNETSPAAFRFSVPIALEFSTHADSYTVKLQFDYDEWNGGRFVRLGQTRIIRQDTVDEKPSSGKWMDLAARFEKIPNVTRANWQCNRKNNATTYEEWRFAGGHDSKQCETLCRYAGTLLMKSSTASADVSANVRQQTDAAWSWLFFLKEKHGALRSDGLPPIGTDGTIYLMGTITEVAAVSARVCMECAALEL